MKRQFSLTKFLAVFSVLAMSASAMAQSSHRYHSTYTSPTESPGVTDWAANRSPWDFSGLIGLYNPGFGLEALAAYRVADRLISTTDNSLSIEAGLGFVSVSDTALGIGISYSEVEIPIMARWDFHFPDSHFTVGPRAGFDILTAGTATINGATYTDRGGGLFFQLGGFGTYQFSDHWAARLQLMFISYTSLTAGVTFFL